MAAPKFDKPLGAFVLRQVSDFTFLKRRVEAVQLLDGTSVLRQVTIEIDTERIGIWAADSNYANPGAVNAILPLIVTVLRKQLLVDFEVRSSRGSALQILTRVEDSRLSYHALLACAEKEGLIAEAELICDHIYDIVLNFPNESDDPDDFSRSPISWRPPTSWQANEIAAWNALIKNPSWLTLLYEFTFNFLLVIDLQSVKSGKSREALTFSYRSNYEWKDTTPFLSRFLIRPKELALSAPALGIPEVSVHLEVSAPPAVFISDLRLVAPRSGLDQIVALDSQSRLTGDRAQVYTYSAPVRDYSVRVGLLVPLRGLLRQMTLATALATTVLWLGFILLHRLVGDSTTAIEAATTLLLVSPSLLTAYLARENEHECASMLLRPIRFLVGFTSLGPYFLAWGLLLKYHGAPLRYAWLGISVSVSISLLVLVRACFCATVADKIARAGRTRRIEIYPE